MKTTALNGAGMALFVLLGMISCSSPTSHEPTSTAATVGEGLEDDDLRHPEWSKNATIY
ncbi:MAG: hypothetical protein ACO2ZL_05550 [Flavobacteriales bacterium]